MTERGDQVQRLLAGLAKHADLVAEAYEGSISGGDRQRNSAIEALFNLSVLMAYDEDEYRLNPRIREFISDHFSSYQVLQALRRVSGTMHQAREQWSELRRLKAAGSMKDQARVEKALDESIVEIAYSIEQNLAMLHSLISTQYGNVDDLASKLRQNRFYARQVDMFLRDVESIDAFVEMVSNEAIAAGLPYVRNVVTRRLGAKRLSWTSQIKDAQAAISKRLFEARLMEQQLRRLSRFALWIGRNKTMDGWDVAVDEKTPHAVAGSQALGFRPQPDVSDPDSVTMEGVMAAIARLPLLQPVAPVPQEASPQILIEDDEHVEFALSAEHAALEDLALAAANAHEAISLLVFKRERHSLVETSDAAWMVFACAQLRMRKFQLDFVEALEEDPFPINEHFHDVQVRAPLVPASLQGHALP